MSNPPEGFKVPIFDVALLLVSGEEYLYILYNVANRIRGYLDLYSDVILYFIYDDKEINRGKRHQHLKPQQYRSYLFSTFFERNSGNVYSKNIEINNPENNGCLCWTLAGLTKNTDVIESLADYIEIEATK